MVDMRLPPAHNPAPRFVHSEPERSWNFLCPIKQYTDGGDGSLIARENLLIDFCAEAL